MMTQVLKQFSLAFILVLFAVLVNLPIINYDMMYPEQPLMYIANQKIHHFSDLLNVYLHPQIMHYAIPFFRPSGHFLMYQLLTPFTGWQNTKIFLLVNFIFLGLTGFMMTKLYQQLFTKYWVGGLIAFAIYLAHPSLTLVKASVLHFEFAHVFFALLGLYYFIEFCRAERNADLVKAVLAYVIAVTFKESAVMLGPVYAVYYCIAKYQYNLFNRQAFKVLLLLGIVTISLGMYLMLAWPLSTNPVREVFLTDKIFAAIKSFMIYIFSWVFLAKYEFLGNAYKDFESIWRLIVFPFYIAVIMSVSGIIAISTAVLLRKSNDIQVKKSYIFLIIAALMFLIIPFGWGVGAPWHYHLTLIMLSLMFGFAAEYLATIFISNHAMINKCGILLALVIGLTTVATNFSIVHDYRAHPIVAYPLALGRNAFDHAPALSKLNNESLLIVEDSGFKRPYFIGAAFFPLQLYYLANKDFYIRVVTEPTQFFLPLDQNYNGSLFKWAYELPGMKEEIIPFSIDNLSRATPSLIYQWLLHYDNIFYITYDANGEWHDMTEKFKRNLLQEKQRRKIMVRNIHDNPAANQKLMREISLPAGDAIACQFMCDQDKKCNSYRYITNKFVAACRLYR